ncbi:hypothetical protein [Halorussus sp. AFM4]|uniref:hypothetical protein n=1 Tax=Halorussus sp. AFM4 TaxID=3421651 RepID=UPI003EBAA063
MPLSPLTAGRRVGPNYPERRGIVADGAVAGEMDDMSAYAGPDFDPGAVAPAVRDFYERTADYRLAYEVRWHRPFRLGAALASGPTSRVEQLNLPGPREAAARAGPDARELGSRFARVDPAADPRPGARAWVRTNAAGEAVFVAIYAHHERDGTRYVNIAVPLPGANLSTVLRPENSDDDRGGVELTTLGGPADGDEGLYLATPLGNVALPLDQRFRVRPAEGDASDLGDDAPSRATGEDAAVVASHEMWVFGRRFLTIRYVGSRRSAE